MNNEIIAIVLIVIGLLASFIANLILTNRISKLEDINNENPKVETATKKLNISFDEMNKIIDSVFEEISQNKYLIHYILREIKVIPKMDEEIKSLTMDVLHAFSPEFRETLYSVYSEDYVIQMITRRSQKFMIDYLDKHKPRSK